jgi:hypothetical protein
MHHSFGLWMAPNAPVTRERHSAMFIWIAANVNPWSVSNAFFYGLPYLTKHIVLYDTLLDQSTPEEVEAVLAHELGHWKFNHSMYMLAMSEVLVLTNLSLLRLSIFNPALVSSTFMYTHTCLTVLTLKYLCKLNSTAHSPSSLKGLLLSVSSSRKPSPHLWILSPLSW